MADYVEVLPDPGRALSQLFTYRLPARLAGRVEPGSQVLVPFGPRTVAGVVAALRGRTDRTELKEVEAVLEGGSILPADALPLAEWIAERYLCELGEALRLFIPHGGRYRIARRFRLTGKEIPASLRARREVGAVLRALEAAGKPVSHGALRRALPGPRLSRVLQLLKAHQVIEEEAALRPPTARQRRIRLAAVPDREAARRYCREAPPRAAKRVACLETALREGALTPAELAKRAGVSSSVVNALLKAGLLEVRWRTIRRTPWREAEAEADSPPTLTPEQREAVDEIAAAAEEPRFSSFLLFGVTASGKTEVFLRAMERALARGRQAIVLMPEISLTAQAVSVYRARFGDRVAVLHSALSTGERWDEWERIRSGEASVVIGARSALFAPTGKLGLIVVDEEHETSYKQEQAPRYLAREVALKRGELAGCPVVLASATPSLEAFYDAERGRHRLLRLPTRVEQRPLPRVRVVDMRGRSAQPAIFSPPLRQAMARCLEAGEQAILFLNRRGFATFLLCPMCGEAARCPDCGVALTFHRQAGQVRCHHCGLAMPPPDACPHCGGVEIRFSGFGTERVERELVRLLPRARVGRLDRDTVSTKGAHVRIVGGFHRADTDVLVGTQMVAKGFDFPGVTLVGVISADRSLNVPDFRAAERTFQLLTQVAGRSGRGEKPGEVLIQTYQPEHYSILAAAEQDYEAFYRQEIEARRELNYPPFSQLVSITVSSADEQEASDRAQQVADQIRAAARGVEVLGPAEAPLAKLRGRYRRRVLVRGRPGETVEAVRDMAAGWRGWSRGTITVDVDPLSFM